MENKTRKLTEEEKQKVIYVITDCFFEELPEEPTEYDVLMRQKDEEFIAHLIEKEVDLYENNALLEMCEEYIKEDGKGLSSFGLVMMYDMWINESSVWPVMHNPKWDEWEKLEKIKAKKDANKFSSVPKELKAQIEEALEKKKERKANKINNYEKAMELVKINGIYLEEISDEIKTKELCLVALQNNYNALEYVPENLMTEELCLAVLRKNGFALQHVPENIMTAEMCHEAVKSDGKYAFQFVPEKFKTAELCREAVWKDGINLRDVPEKLKTVEMCNEAVRKEGWALRYVPEKLKTAEMCHVAVKQDGFILECVPEKLRTAELCLLAVTTQQETYSWNLFDSALKLCL